MTTERTGQSRMIILAIGEPAFYLLVNRPEKAHRLFGPAWARDGEEVAKVSVMSPAAGGEVRGYWMLRGRLHLCTPVYIAKWRDVDAAVAAELEMEVRGPDQDDGGLHL